MSSNQLNMNMNSIKELLEEIINVKLNIENLIKKYKTETDLNKKNTDDNAVSVSDSDGSDSDEYEAYEEYYEADDDGGYFLFDESFLITIPGYSLFRNDKLKLNPNISTYEVNCEWKILKKNNINQLKCYIEEYEENNPYEYENHIRKYGYKYIS